MTIFATGQQQETAAIATSPHTALRTAMEVECTAAVSWLRCARTLFPHAKEQRHKGEPHFGVCRSQLKTWT